MGVQTYPNPYKMKFTMSGIHPELLGIQLSKKIWHILRRKTNLKTEPELKHTLESAVKD